MLLQNKKVAIIGAGPVGLMMAKLLQQKGTDVTVYERDKNPMARISGGTLDLHKGAGLDAMEKARLLEQYYAMAIPMGRTVADDQGKVLFSKKAAPMEQYDNPEINRNDLRLLLLESLKAGTVIWDRKFTTLDADNGQWTLYFENGTSAAADLVIGANGGMSGARKYVTDAAIEYTGTIIVQGEVPEPETNCPGFFQLCNDNILMTASQSHLLVANPKNGDLLTYNVMFSKPEEWGQEMGPKDKASMCHFLSDRLASWDERYRQLFGVTSSFVVWPTRKISLNIPWKNNRPLPITLIGDAAHIMPPFAGQGVNTGLLDALILSENLTEGRHASLEEAIRDYEQKMIAYASEAQAETSSNEWAMLQPDFSFLKFYQ